MMNSNKNEKKPAGREALKVATSCQFLKLRLVGVGAVSTVQLHMHAMRTHVLEPLAASLVGFSFPARPTLHSHPRCGVLVLVMAAPRLVPSGGP